MSKTLYSLCLIALVVSAGLAAADGGLRHLSVAGGKVVAQGLQPIDTTSPDDTPAFTTMGGADCLIAAKSNMWLRVLLTEALSQDYRGPVTIGIRYFDNSGPVVMQFDSSDPTRLRGAWCWSPAVWRTGTQTWRTAFWTIEKPGFTHRELGADFSITGYANRGFDPLYIGEVTVSQAGILPVISGPGLALGDHQTALVTAKVLAPDGKPAPDGTKVRFAATLGTCAPAEAPVAGGEAVTTFTPAGKAGDATISMACDFSAAVARLALVEGTGGVREVDWPVADFENADPNAKTESYDAGAVAAKVRICPEAAHNGKAGALVTYKYTGEIDWFNAGTSQDVRLPGVLRGINFWAKASEPNCEICCAVLDAEAPKREDWNWSTVVVETSADGWRRHVALFADPYFPNRNAVFDYPLSFASVYINRRPWSPANAGTLCVDDIVARLIVSGSEAEKLTAAH